jgi:Flp pilus assembly pilin Flp
MAVKTSSTKPAVSYAMLAHPVAATAIGGLLTVVEEIRKVFEASSADSIVGALSSYKREDVVCENLRVCVGTGDAISMGQKRY